MKHTPFFSLHQKHKAKIVPFGGFEMPIHYTSILEEHKKVRTNVGVFDVSHMGEFFVTGKNAQSFLQKITINDVTKLVPGKAQYSAMCLENGNIIDDLLVYMLAENSYMVVVNASNIEKDFQWMQKHLLEQVELINKSDETSLLAVQGPDSEKVLQQLTKSDLKNIPYYNFVQGKFADVEMIISRTGYTGELGFELYFDAQHSEKIWNAIFEKGKAYNIAPIGLGARDTLRLEMGYCLYGNDIDETSNPLEANLGWITKISKGDFIGKSALEKVKANGVQRKLVGLVLQEKSVPRHGYEIFKGEKSIGTVTSGTFSPSLEQGIAMGYIPTEYSSAGTTVQVDIRGKKINAVVTQVPFLKK